MQGVSKRPRLDSSVRGSSLVSMSTASQISFKRQQAMAPVSFLTQLLPDEISSMPRGKSQVAKDSVKLENQRRSAAQTFYDLLVLQNRGYVQLEQRNAYEDVEVIPAGPLVTPKI